jgi:hypothetical protein
MKLSRLHYLFFFLIFLISIELTSPKLYKDDPDDIAYQEYLSRISNKKYSKKNVINNNNPHYNRYDNYDYDNNENNDFTEKPTSSFDFLYKSVKNQIKAYFSTYNEYFEGFYYVLSKYQYLFRRFSSNKIINKTITSTNKPKYQKYFEENSKNEDNSINNIRNLAQTIKKKKEEIKRKIKKNKVDENVPINNTDLYNTTKCPTSPDLKVYYYYYFCNGEKVSKKTYEEKMAQGEKCEFYNNTQKLCFCPIHYTSCALKGQSRIRCMAKEVIVDDKTNLTQYYDTFYEEFFKTPILDNKLQVFDFSVKLKCGMSISDEITGGPENYYLSSDEFQDDDFDIISTVYNGTEEGKQYSKEEVKNKTTKVLKYFIKKKNLVMYEKPKMSLKFSLIDQHWVVPYRIKTFDIKEDLVEDLLSGEKSFNFTVDINDMIVNELGIGPFSQKDSPYPHFDKGDLHFFEFDIEDENKQMRFYPVRGEIKK